MTFNISSLLLGDANDNGAVNISDPVAILNELRRQNNPENDYNEVFSFINSDIDTNKQIEMVDVNATINIVQGKDPFATAGVSSRSYGFAGEMVADNFNPDKRDLDINVSLTNPSYHTALQADVIIPAGMTVTEVRPGTQLEGHSITYDINKDNVMRVLVYSLNITPFRDDEGPLFVI